MSGIRWTSRIVYGLICFILLSYLADNADWIVADIMRRFE